MKPRLTEFPCRLRTLLPLLVFAGVAWQGRLARAETGDILDDGRVVISSELSPRVAWAVEGKAEALEVRVSVAHFPGAAGGIGVELGVASAGAEVRLSGRDAVASVLPEGEALFSFRIPGKDWDDLRVGLAVEWGGGVSGKPRQREAFLLSGGRAAHDGLGPAGNWQAVSLTEFAARQEDHRNEAAIAFTQPMDGKATVVIDDSQGRRVRNLVSAKPLPAGKHRLVWDVCDDAGNLLPPGDYHWRAISHPGVTPVYEFSFCDGPGSNHGTFHAAATNGTDLFFGTPVSEGGYQLVRLDTAGRQIQGFNAPNGIGLGRVALAADADFLYAAYDGSGWGEHTDRGKPGWKADYKISLLRFDLKAGRLADFGRERFREIHRYSVGPGSPGGRPDEFALAGLALLEGRLYLADADRNQVMEIDAGTGAVQRTIPMEKPGALAASGGALFAVAGRELVQLNLKPGGKHRVIMKLDGKPSGLAIGQDGGFLVSDAASQTVRVLSAKGLPQGVIGKPGGVHPGAYDPECLTNPAGLVVSPDGHVWITESERWKPKRLAAFNLSDGKVWKEFFGPTAYGAPGSGFDAQDAGRWIGQGTIFQLDFAAKSARPVSILGGMEGRSWRYWRQEGRTFLLSTDKATCVQELMPDNTLKVLAIQSTAHLFSYWHNWNPPAAFVAAYHRDYPEKPYRPGTEGRPDHGVGMLWADRNGNGEMDEAEIEFSTSADNMAGAGWGNDFADLTLRIPAQVKGRPGLVTLRPEGWWPGGAPKYPDLNDAIRQGVPTEADGIGAETTVDRFGNMLVNGDPELSAVAPDGRVLWTYPNRWRGVHGSHDAPLPTPGELQGVLFFTGVAPLDGRSDVVAMNGNHGRLFLMTSDGLYLDEMFTDCRLMTNPQANGVGILGGECFGGTFGRDAKSGNFYYQGGGIEYRIYRVEGLSGSVRSEGVLTVSGPQVTAAERRQVRRAAETRVERKAVIPFTAGAGGEALDAADPVAQWQRGGDFPVAVRAVSDGTRLHISWTVKDGSPWVNGGKDWQMLFKTGDSVDLQLGTDPAARPDRAEPVPGDVRLLVAPFEDGNAAVLYRHRVPGAPESAGVVFQSPWRNARVDSVARLDSAEIRVKRQGDSYQVAVSVPLADLGLAAAALGQPLRGDFGVIYGDAAGATNIFRNYWSNAATGLVNDVPGEIMLTPRLWGSLTIEKQP